MRVLSLFSGIGGLELGLERAGMSVVGQCEIEPFCLAVLEKHWPGVPRWTDVKEINGTSVRERCGPVDLVCGGFPCQDISVAGKGVGLSGERSGLWWEMRRVIEEVRPTWVLAENVPALRTRGGDEVLTALEGLGYTCWPLAVGAWAVAAPHKRDRVWIVAYAEQDGRRQGSGVSSNEVGEGGGWSESARSLQLADTQSRGLGAGGQPLGSAGHTDIGDASVADTEPGGRGRWHTTNECREVAGSACASGKEQLEHAIGVDGVGGLHEPLRFPQGRTATRWPSRPGEPQHEWEEARLVESAVGGTANGPARRLSRWRRSALRALGNGVVPQVSEAIGSLIMEMHLDNRNRPAT